MAEFIQHYPQLIHTTKFESLIKEIDKDSSHIQYQNLLQIYDTLKGVYKDRVYTGELQSFGQYEKPLYE